ncbi:hypothetical protein P389DRAFT_197697 [Cystobasidium minutum MCA 4210]|uniref:uncharacterized protein n=1 Tax=Cystobasidium minutum MCA 4210 TaxID=1397322 RepID=UPI0034CEF28E|eukprot:jgi/Rhomi1/197697/gm1.5911_g
MSLINEHVFLKAPLHRPSHASRLHSLALTSEEALDRFMQEQSILEAQLRECEEFYKYLLDVRTKRKSGQTTFEQLSELTEGFYVKTEIEMNDPGTFVVSLGLHDNYIELELEEAVAYAQQREQYLRVAKLSDRLNGLQAEIQMDYAQLAEILESVRQQNMSGQTGP